MQQENEQLKAQLAAQSAELARLVQLNQKLVHYIRGMLRGRYGRSTEKLLGDPVADQHVIAEVEAFLNAERTTVAEPPVPPAAASPAAPPAATPPVPAPAPASATDKPAVRGSRRRPSQTFPQLEIKARTVDVPEATRIDADGRPMVACGSVTVETVVFKAPEVYRCLSKAGVPTPELGELTPKAWAARHGQVISRAS